MTFCRQINVVRAAISRFELIPMTTKKLYSIRLDINILDALRSRADEEDVTISELIHQLLSEGLDLAPRGKRYKEVSDCDFADIVEKIKIEVKNELVRDMLASCSTSRES